MNDSEDSQSLSENELGAVRTLQRTIRDPFLRRLLDQYVRSAGADYFQSALRMVVSPFEPEVAAVHHLQRISQNSALKTILARYLAGEFAAPPVTNPAITSFHIPINSFPKSGNTWVRQFISCLCFDGDLEAIPDHYTGDIGAAPSFRLPDGRDVKFYKSHDKAPLLRASGQSIHPPATIHIRRHPLDVFVSHLNFLHLEKDRSDPLRPTLTPFLTNFSGIDEIIEKDMAWLFLGIFIVFGNLNPTFTQAGSWFENIAEWSKSIPGTAQFNLTYEGLLEQGADCLRSTGMFLGKDEAAVQKAFEEAQRRTAKDGKFFWKQKAGMHLEMLKPEQIAAFYAVHGDRLKSLGY